MALSADQRALLELLLGRGQTYDDISSLLGTPAEEVRSKARWALAELGGADPDRNVALSDYLLGQADPIGRADAVRHLRNDSADRDLAERLKAQLREIAPEAELPQLPSEGRTAPHLRAPNLPRRAPRERDAKPQAPTDPARTRLLMALGTGGLVLVVVVLAVAGVFSGGDSSDADIASTTTSPSGTTSTTAGANSETITPLKLQPVGGGPGSGTATFGLGTGDQPFMDLRISDLPPPGNGQVYAAWLVVNTAKRLGYPLAPLVPYPASGPYHDTFSIPSPAIPLIKGIEAVDVTTAPAKELAAKIKAIATQQSPKIVLSEIGTTVLRAPVPRGQTSSGTDSSGAGSG